jgi:hypothetical protein
MSAEDNCYEALYFNDHNIPNFQIKSTRLIARLRILEKTATLEMNNPCERFPSPTREQDALDEMYQRLQSSLMIRNLPKGCLFTYNGEVYYAVPVSCVRHCVFNCLYCAIPVRCWARSNPKYLVCV